MKEKYVAFLRGINVGGHHKVPMAELRKILEKLGFMNVVTLLNSGNIVFDADAEDPDNLEKLIAGNIEKAFGFPVPTIIRKSDTILQLINEAPFGGVEINKDIRLYVSFLSKNTESDLVLPWTSPDKSYRIILKRDKSILSILDLSVSNTPKAMESIEKYFGKGITTRNWKTIEKIGKIL